MRLRFLSSLFIAGLLAVRAAPAAAPGSVAVPPSVPAPDELPPVRDVAMPYPLPTLEPITQIDGRAFLPKNLLLSPTNFPPPETRTTAQLEAMLAAYVGTWRGTSTWASSTSATALTYPTELVYQFASDKDRRVLRCAIRYTVNGITTTSQALLWIENGHLVSTVAQNGSTQKFIAGTDHEAVRWQAADSLFSPIDYAETETLRLTVDGGQLSTIGFQMEHGVHGDVFVYETSSLKLVK